MLQSYASQYEAEVKMKINVLVVQPMKSDKIPQKKKKNDNKKRKHTKKKQKMKRKNRHQFIKYCTQANTTFCLIGNS